MTDHTVRAYDRELEQIGLRIAEMGGIAEKMLVDAMEVLSRMDSAGASRVIQSDMRLDTLKREIEEAAIQTIARRQPVARDLREIISAIHTANDLERVGDLAKNIAKRTLKNISPAALPRATIGLRHMADLAATQLKHVLDAYAARDSEHAREIWEKDAEIDAMEDSIFRELLTFMMEDPRNITYCTHLLFCSKNIERIGDHATNIAETIHFLVTGENLPLERPKWPDAAAAQI